MIPESLQRLWTRAIRSLSRNRTDASSSSGLFYNRLRRNIILQVLLISLTPLLLMGGIFYYEFSFLYRNKIEEQLKYRARVQANTVDFFLRERAAVLSSIGDLYDLDTLVEPEELGRIFKVLTLRTGGFVDLGVIDSKGDHLAYVGPYDLLGRNYYQQPWFGEVMSKGVYISDVYMGYRQIPHFIVAVRRQENRRTWILRATIDSDVFNVLVHEAKVGQTGDAFIVNREGIYQTQPRFRGQVLSAFGVDPARFGEGAVIEKVEGDGRKILCVGSWLKNRDWLLVIEQDEAEGMRRFLQNRYAMMVYIGFGCLAIVLVTLFTTNLAVRRLEKIFQKRGEVSAQILQHDKLASLGKMAAGIAHEINNPLAVIGEKTGWMQDLLEEEAFRGSPNYQEYRDALQKIGFHVERARKTIYTMLSYARKMEPHQEDVSINEVLQQTIDFVRNVARIHNIRIETEFEPALPIIASDQAQLQQVFLNILNNAIDAIGEDGRVQIRTKLEDLHIVVDIRDTGPGIPREHQKRIFDPFFTTKPAGKGSGLGLWICFNIVEKMGGTIAVESEEGKGTTFSVRLPVVVPERT